MFDLTYPEWLRSRDMLDNHWNLIYHINFHIPDVTKHVPLIFLNSVLNKRTQNMEWNKLGKEERSDGFAPELIK